MHAQSRHVAQRGGQTDGIGHVGRARLEACGRLVELRLLDGHVLDHVAPTLPWRQEVQPAALAVDDTDARGGVNLVAAEDKEIGVEGLHINGRVGYALRAVHKDGDATAVGRLDDARHVVDGAEGVVDVPHGDELGAWREQSLILVEQEITVGADGDGHQVGALLLAHLLPGHYVGVVVQGGDDDLVARLEERAAEGLRHQVYALGGAAHEDYLLGGGCVDEVGHRLAGILIGVSGTGGQGVRSAVDVAVAARVVVGEGLDDLTGLLRGGPVVEPHEVVAVHLLAEDGEVLAYRVHGQRVNLLVAQLAQRLRLGDAYAEAVDGQLVKGALTLVAGRLGEGAAAGTRFQCPRSERREVVHRSPGETVAGLQEAAETLLQLAQVKGVRLREAYVVR